MYKILGTTDENTTCDCCGKTNLKKTVVLESENGTVYFGVDCAARAILGTKNAKNNQMIDKQANAIQYAKNMVARYGVEKAVMAVWNKYGFPTDTKNGKMRVWIAKGQPVEI